MPRKTVEIDVLKDAANAFLAAPDSFSIEGRDAASMRLGVASLLETALHRSGNYKGFQHLATEWDAENWRLRDGYDDSRRRYF